MSPTEREQWAYRLLCYDTSAEAVDAVLDRVELLETKLAAARAAPRHCGEVIPAGADWRRCLGCGDCWREESPIA